MEASTVEEAVTVEASSKETVEVGDASKERSKGTGEEGMEPKGEGEHEE